MSQFGKICHYLNIHFPLWVWYRNYFRNNDGRLWILGICSASPSPWLLNFALTSLGLGRGEKRGMHLFQGWAVMLMIWSCGWFSPIRELDFLESSSKETGLAPHAIPCLLSVQSQSQCKGEISQVLFPHSGFPGGSVVKNLPVNAGDSGSIPGLGRSPGEGNGSPLQYPCLGNSMDREVWQATVHGVTKELNTT